eukprot:2791854-Prymnesium_polylepis.2
MLDEQDDGSMKVNVERTAAMLSLTAIHDIMKITDLLPRLLKEHAPYHGFDADDEIGDHDIALGYVLEHDPAAIPCFVRLAEPERAPVRFTQAKLGFNHGWLVQAEAPPGALFNNFKKVVEGGGIDNSMIAFYFVHWLTDLGGAVPTPLKGVEKFVVQFPMSVLASFIQSFPLVQRLSDTTQTDLMEMCLFDWWPSDLGDAPMTHDAVAKMRLVVQAQTLDLQRKVVFAFDNLIPIEREILAGEMARTGISGQAYNVSPQLGGPAFLVYYSPAFIRQSMDCMPMALTVLAQVYTASRTLFPLASDPQEAGRSVTVRIDQLKACGDAKGAFDKIDDNSYWVVKRTNNQEAVVECLSLGDMRTLIALQDTSQFQVLRLWAPQSAAQTVPAPVAPDGTSERPATSKTGRASISPAKYRSSV